MGGAPVEGATVSGWDDALPYETWDAACATAPETCALFAISGADGGYAISVPMAGPAVVHAVLATQTAGGLSVRLGDATAAAPAPSCPAAALDVHLDDGFDFVNLTVAYAGGDVSWTPDVGASSLGIWSWLGGEYKWVLAAAQGAGAFPGPVTYGTAPQGGAQRWPLGTAAPAPLAACDELSVVAGGWLDRIYTYGWGDCVLVAQGSALACLPRDAQEVADACSASLAGTAPASLPRLPGPGM
jgi:hypothetical protein